MSGYATVVADPPWDQTRLQHRSGDGWGAGHGSEIVVPYRTMAFEEIVALPVSDLAAHSAHLYLWTTNRWVERAYDVVRAWGFSPSVLVTWCKTPRGIGLGGTFVQTSEHVIFARRGSLKAKRRIDTTWFNWPRGEHSAKPEAFLDLVESVSPGPYLEMFSRRARLGWDTWGDEALHGLEAISA